MRVVKDQDFSPFETETIKFARGGLYTSIVALFATAIAAFVFYFQFGEMKSQTQLLKDSLEKAKQDSLAAEKAQFIQTNILQSQLNELRGQAAETRRLAQNSQIELGSVQRAFVNFSNSLNILRIMPTPEGTEAKSVYFRIPLSNIGNTPTRGLAIYCDAQVFPRELPRDYRLPDAPTTPQTRIILPPKSMTSSGDAPFCEVGPFTADQIKAVESEPATNLYIWSWAKYRDVFPGTPSHITKFCVRLTRWGDDLLSTENKGTIDYTTCPFHNCEDEECAVEAAKAK